MAVSMLRIFWKFSIKFFTSLSLSPGSQLLSARIFGKNLNCSTWKQTDIRFQSVSLWVFSDDQSIVFLAIWAWWPKNRKKCTSYFTLLLQSIQVVLCWAVPSLLLESSHQRVLSAPDITSFQNQEILCYHLQKKNYLCCNVSRYWQ